MPTTASLRQSAHSMIVSWGGGLGQLRRGAVARDVYMAIMDYTWQERQTVAVDAVVKIRLSCVPSDPAPDEQQDIVIFKGSFYKINAKPRPAKPANDVIYWDIDCLEVSEDDVS